METVTIKTEMTEAREAMRKQLKAEIRKKYGSIQHFAKLSDLHYSKLCMFFVGRFKESSEQQMAEQIKILCDTNADKMKEQLMTEAERLTIRGIMFSKFKNVRTFCLDHDEFNITFVSKVINGQRRKKDKKYERFIEVISQ